jgi:hypothetical protein
MKQTLTVLLALSTALGCVPANRDDGFRALKPLGAVPSDSGPAPAADTSKTASVPDQAQFGFSVELTGPAELHFADEEGRHTGPATAEEYLPVLEAALRNPSLHEQERAGLERMREQIRRTGSASGMAVTRRIPNLDYQPAAGTVRATYRGAEELDLKVASSDYAVFKMTVKVWDRERVRTAGYDFSAGPGQEGGLDISALMDDFTLSWDSNGDGEPDREIPPAKTETARRR